MLPGVGAFPDAMRNLRARGLDEALASRWWSRASRSSACASGMQLLGTCGHEGGDTEGLGWIDGEVRRLEPAGADRRIPHVGWNEVAVTRDSPLFAGDRPGRDFYFVHSFHLVCHDEADVLATTPYCGGFVSAVSASTIFGVQFHPEKSQRLGFRS